MANNYSYTYPLQNQFIENQMQNLQDIRNRAEKEMKQIQQMQNQNQFIQPQQPQIQQTFQLSNPNQNTNDFDGKYVENIEEVKNTLIFRNSLFLNKDLSKLWIKDANGNIRIFNLEEEIQVDESVEEINNLKKELSELKTLLVQQLQQNQNQKEEKSEPIPIAKIQPATKIERKVK